jgi:hypothetical protein
MGTAGASLHGPHFELFLWLRDRTPAGGSISTGAGMTGPGVAFGSGGDQRESARARSPLCRVGTERSGRTLQRRGSLRRCRPHSGLTIPQIPLATANLVE